MNAILRLNASAARPEDLVTRQMPAAPVSWDPDAWTFDVVLATTSGGVPRYDARGEYTEFLGLEDETWPDRVPLLDSHQRDSVDRRLGSVDQIRSVGGEMLGRATLSRNNPLSRQVAADIADGHVPSVSIGYITREQRERPSASNRRREMVAVRIELMEASLVLLPADRSAGIRSLSMTVTPAPVAAPVTPPAPAVPVTSVETVQERAAPTSPAIVDRAAINGEIRSLARTAGLDQSWIDSQIDANSTPDQARAAAFAAMQARALPAGSVRSASISTAADCSNPELRVRHVGEALYARYTPGHQLSEQARAHFGQTTLDIARECLRLRGIAHAGLPIGEVFQRALHSTSDFPLILGDSIGRTLREAYRAAPSGLKMLGRKTTARDFKEKHRLQLSEAPRLLKVNEDGEFKSGTLAEGKESYKLATFGRIIGITRQALINDDLGAFADLSRRIGLAAAATEAQLLADLIQENGGLGPTMGDGKTLFHADHKNKAAAGAALAVPKLGEARTAMRKQVGLSEELIDVTPRFLLVPPELETAAEQVLTALNPTKAEDTNPFAGKLGIAVEPRLTSATRWYVSADPATVDGLEYAYLEGEEGVQIETKAGFEVDGVQIKARLDFGAGFVDWRGWYTNAGA